MGFVDPNTVSNPTTGQVAPASWGDAVRDALIFLVDPPQFAARGAATQNVNTSTDTVLTAGTEDYDSDGMHSTSSNTGRGTVATAGKYRANAVIAWDSDTTGRREVRFLVNGTTQHVVGVTAAVASLTQNVSKMLVLAAGDYVEVQVWQNSGTTRAPQLLQWAMHYEMR